MNVSKQRKFLVLGCASAFLVLVIGMGFVLRAKRRPVQETAVTVFRPLTRPVRAEPERFPPNTHMPPIREGIVSGSIDLKSFSAARDLIRIGDRRVWWESDHDRNDDEDDHLIHKSMEMPLRRLIELVCRRGGKLKVQDTYRPVGIHNVRSLHKEGRAVDVTCEEMSLEQLAGLCWAAGFDWVYYEASSRSGAHIHCSVRRDRSE